MRINHFDLTRYLNEIGWHKISNKRNDIAIFQTHRDNKRWQVTVPLSTELCDYEDALTKTVKTLVEYTGLPENLLLLEIVFSKADILRFRLENENVLISKYEEFIRSEGKEHIKLLSATKKGADKHGKAADKAN